MSDESYLSSIPQQYEKVKKIVAGGHHSIILTSDNKIYTFGLAGQG